MEWLTYLLKVTACTALFYAFYHFCLRNLTFFAANRIYLVATLLISFAIPAVQFEVERAAINLAQVKEDVLFPLRTFADVRDQTLPDSKNHPQATEVTNELNWQLILFSCYWLIAAVILCVSAFQGLKLLKHARKVNLKIGRLKVIFKPDGFTNCSFLNYVFVNQQELTEEEMNVILQHEQVHVARYHSVDKLLISACKALLWFSPIIYLYDSALEQTHEYEADKETSLTMGDTPYANLLLAMAVKKNNPSLVLSFVRNPLKGRIKMLFTNQSKNMKKLTYLAVLPVGLALTWAFTVQVVYASLPDEAIQQTLVAPSDNEAAPLQTTTSQEVIKTEKPEVSDAPADTLWMIDYPSLGKYSEVVINGKSYGPNILTKMSPGGIKSIKGSDSGRLEITTWGDKLEYATEIDKENVRTRNKAMAGKFYARYRKKSQDGSRYDYAEIKVPGSGGGGVSIDKGKKLLLVYEGRQYSERKFKALTADQFRKRAMTFRSTDEEIAIKYGKGYGSMIEVFSVRDIVGYEPQPFRDLNNADAGSKLSYQVKDSIWLSDDKKNSTLFGGVKITHGKLNITADKAKTEDAGQIVYAKNVSFTSELHHNPVTASFMKFNLKDGTYQIIKHIPDL
ncbi:M56 family metallopeptidase [Pedobacter psychroterrae]|uniref:Peptidase M56 domain-containing protein n=1 Tax=Pedobacter psychroterrae TaxID=2530453 RepID=A0A4R0NRF7_9SPHI|nr:M56 family metallopeptidase [Pedobacter psychroterrae]TCD03436.1 hypothetical protein EZ437_05560 [Pedobacter psychroterrae]